MKKYVLLSFKFTCILFGKILLVKLKPAEKYLKIEILFILNYNKNLKIVFVYLFIITKSENEQKMLAIQYVESSSDSEGDILINLSKKTST